MTENEPVLLPTEAVEALLAWYGANRRELPWRRTNDPYRIWISEIMLQQTRVEAVKRYYARFLEAFGDVAALANAPETCKKRQRSLSRITAAKCPLM